MDDQKVVRADLGEGLIIQVEAHAPLDPEADVSITDAVAFAGVVKAIKAITQGVKSAIDAVSPERATVEFGLDIALEPGGLTALLVKSSGSATLTITLEWERQATGAN